MIVVITAAAASAGAPFGLPLSSGGGRIVPEFHRRQLALGAPAHSGRPGMPAAVYSHVALQIGGRNMNVGVAEVRSKILFPANPKEALHK